MIGNVPIPRAPVLISGIIPLTPGVWGTSAPATMAGNVPRSAADTADTQGTDR